MVFPTRTPPYEVEVVNLPTGRAKPKPYRQVRQFQIAEFNTDYKVPIGEEWVIRSVIVFFTTGAAAGDRYWWFYIKAADTSFVAYQRYFNKHSFAVNSLYTDVLGVGLDTANFEFDSTGKRSGSTQPLIENRLINDDSFLFGFTAKAGDSVQAVVLYEKYQEGGY